jgi:anhydro-N-acetylmuramic acid kinase
LGIEWVEQNLIHLLEKYPIPIKDILHTYVVHIAECIGKDISRIQSKTVLITGGGAYHQFLIDQIQTNCSARIHIPDDATIQYKEALIFGLLGLLRWLGEVNVLSSVTGAAHDHSSGVIYGRQIF